MEAPGKQQHWNSVYGRQPASGVSWYEARPSRSLEAIVAIGLTPGAAVIDVGAGASTLVDELIGRGYSNLTVLDLSSEALAIVRARLGEKCLGVEFLEQDATQFQPTRRYALWHDRAVFHFLTAAEDRECYRNALRAGTANGSHVFISTFGPQGPLRCSGLETRRYDANALAKELGAEYHLLDSSVDMHLTPGGVQQQFLHAHFIRIRVTAPAPSNP